MEGSIQKGGKIPRSSLLCTYVVCTQYIYRYTHVLGLTHLHTQYIHEQDRLYTYTDAYVHINTYNHINIYKSPINVSLTTQDNQQ